MVTSNKNRTKAERMIVLNTTALISALETAPGVIVPLIREVPEMILLSRRPKSLYNHKVTV